MVSEYNAELFNPDFFEQQRLKNERWGKVSERNPQGRRTAGVMSRPSAFKTKCSFNADLFPTHTFCLPGELTGNPNPQHTIVKCIFNPKFFVAKIFNDRHGKFLKQSRVVQCDFDADLFVPEIFA